MEQMSPSGFKPKVIMVLRWLFFLPLGAVAAWAAWGIVNGLNRITMWMTGIPPDWFFARLFIELAAGCSMGAAFVYVGTKVAPARKTEVVFVLAGIAILASGIALYPSIVAAAGWAIVSGLAIAFGATVVAWSVYTGETDPESI